MDLGFRNAAQAHRRLAPADAQAGRLVPDRDEAADAPVLAIGVEHPGEDQVQARDAAAGDPVFHPVDDIAVAFQRRPRRHVGRRAAGVRLGDADRRLVAVQHQAGRQLLLVLAAIGHDRADRAHIGLDGDPARRAAHLRHLLDDEHGVEIAAPSAAIGFGNRHAEEAGVGHVADVVPRIGFGPVDLGGAVGEDAFGEFAGAGLKSALVAGKREIHDAAYRNEVLGRRATPCISIRLTAVSSEPSRSMAAQASSTTIGASLCRSIAGSLKAGLLAGNGKRRTAGAAGPLSARWRSGSRPARVRSRPGFKTEPGRIECPLKQTALPPRTKRSDDSASRVAGICFSGGPGPWLPPDRLRGRSGRPGWRRVGSAELSHSVER